MRFLIMNDLHESFFLLNFFRFETFEIPYLKYRYPSVILTVSIVEIVQMIFILI
jgi:hypothetical protein